MPYFVSLNHCGRMVYKLVPNSATAHAWRNYFDRKGFATAIVEESLGKDVARVEGLEAHIRRQDMTAFREQQAAQRNARLANGFQPYLRGRWPEFVGVLVGFPLPRERRAR